MAVPTVARRAVVSCVPRRVPIVDRSSQHRSWCVRANRLCWAIRCEPDDLPVAALLLAAAVEHAGSLWKVCVIPDHAKCTLQSDEDDDPLGYFPNDAACDSFGRALRQAGSQEPTGPDPGVSQTDP